MREPNFLSVGMCSHLGHSEFKLVVLIDDSDSVSLEYLLVIDLLKLYIFLLQRWTEGCGSKPATP